MMKDALRGLKEHIGPEGIRVAMITFDADAKLFFDFDDLPDRGLINRRIDEFKIPKQSDPTDFDQDPNFPTVASRAFELLRDELLVPGRAGTGFRSFSVPLLIVTVTDGQTMREPDLFAVLAAEPFNRVAGVSRVGFYLDTSTPNERVLDAIAPDGSHSIVCKGTSVNERDQSLANAADIITGFVAAQDCGTTPTTTITSTPTLTPRCYPILDLVFIIDASTSIDQPASGGTLGNFERIKNFVATGVRNMAGYVSRDKVRVAVVLFETITHFEIQLDDLQRSGVIEQKIRNFETSQDFLNGSVVVALCRPRKGH